MLEKCEHLGRFLARGLFCGGDERLRESVVDTEVFIGCEIDCWKGFWMDKICGETVS